MTSGVLAAIDRDERGDDEVLRQSAAWARELGRPLIVCQAIALPEEASSAPREAREALARRLDRVLPDHGEVELVVAAGKAATVVAGEAAARDPALTVVGASHVGALGRLFFASTSDLVIRRAPTSVLVARASPPSGVIVVGTDLSDHASAALAAAEGIRARRGATLIAAHALELTHLAMGGHETGLLLDPGTLEAVRLAARGALERQLSELGAHAEPLVQEGGAAPSIVRTARERGAELLVVGTHGRTGLSRVALGSVASRVARRAPCSVLVVRGASPR